MVSLKVVYYFYINLFKVFFINIKAHVLWCQATLNTKTVPIVLTFNQRSQPFEWIINCYEYNVLYVTIKLSVVEKVLPQS